MTFELTPPAQEPYRISPTATSPCRPNNVAYVQPIRGMTVNCRPTPINTAFGIRMTRAKSPNAKVVPMPNMMSCTKGITARFVSNPLHEVKTAGKNIAQAAKAKTQRAKANLRKLGEVSAAIASDASAAVTLMPDRSFLPARLKASAANTAVPLRGSRKRVASEVRDLSN